MSKRASVDEISNAIDDFTRGLSSIEKKQFNKVYALLKDLSLDADGKIKPTIENLKVIGRVNNALQGIIDDPQYQDKVSELQGAIDKVNDVQTLYFEKTFTDFKKPPSVKELQKLALDNTTDSLTAAGINENVLNSASDIIEDHIRDGGSFPSMIEKLKEEMLGNKELDSKLVSYSKQIINDQLSGFSRNYHNLVTADLGLEWFEYLGALVDSSRPVCIAAVEKKFFHKSELPALARGVVDGVSVGTEGMMPGTNGSNIMNRCGGYNCSHQLVPISSSQVPTQIRRKFEKDIPADDDELASQRPKRK